MRTVPAVGRRMPISVRISVVFPAPLGPTRPNTAPSGTVKSTPSKAVTPSKILVSPCVSIANRLIRSSPPLPVPLADDLLHHRQHFLLFHLHVVSLHQHLLQHFSHSSFLLLPVDASRLDLCDKAPPPAEGFDDPLPFHLLVGLGDRVGVDGDSAGQLPDRREFIPRGENSPCHRLLHSVHQLLIDGHVGTRIHVKPQETHLRRTSLTNTSGSRRRCEMSHGENSPQSHPL